MKTDISLQTLVLFCAVLLGVAGDVLLRDVPWGANWALWCFAFAAVAVGLVRASGGGQPRASAGANVPTSGGGGQVRASAGANVPTSGGARAPYLAAANEHARGGGLADGWPAMLGVAVVCGVCVAWRDAPALAAFAVLGAMMAGFLGTLPKSSGPLKNLHIIDLFLNAIASLVDSLIGAGLLLGEGRRLETAAKKGWGTAEIVRGILLAVPLLLVFGGLFVAADATFEHLVVRILRIDLPELLLHGFTVFLIAWPLAGIFRDRFLAGGRRISGSPRPSGLSLGLPEVGIAVGSLVLLTAVFLGSQLVYLFGGSAYVLGAPSLTLAEYTRRGFFELVTAAVLVLPVLLVADWLLRKDVQWNAARFRLLALVQMVLLFVLMASAMHRLILYQQEFGLTQLRLYATAILVWLSGVLIWFSATVLRGRRERFAAGAFIGGMLVLLGLHALNPDDLIVKVNIARSAEGKELDTGYLTSLSADAVPRLVASLPALSPPEREIVERKIYGMRGLYAGYPWQSWNYSRSRALNELRALDLKAPVEKAAGRPSGAERHPRDHTKGADSLTSPQTPEPPPYPSQ